MSSLNESKFLGVGWNFPVEPEPDGRIALARYEESVRQSIWMILSTAPGERVMRPDFGCGIHRLVFALNTAGTAGQITSEVSRALALWEPRIEVSNVEVYTDTEQPNLLQIQIEYVVRTTNNRYNLVYPFYLE